MASFRESQASWFYDGSMPHQIDCCRLWVVSYCSDASGDCVSSLVGKIYVTMDEIRSYDLQITWLNATFWLDKQTPTVRSRRTTCHTATTVYAGSHGPQHMFSLYKSIRRDENQQNRSRRSVIPHRFDKITVASQTIRDSLCGVWEPYDIRFWRLTSVDPRYWKGQWLLTVCDAGPTLNPNNLWRLREWSGRRKLWASIKKQMDNITLYGTK